MAHLAPVSRGLRMLYDIGSDRIWFMLAVALGLFAASWLVSNLLGVPFGPAPEGLGY